MNIEEIKEAIAILSKDEVWNHQFYLEGDIKTREFDIQSPGYNTFKWSRLIPILQKIDLTEKTVLDVGSSDGFYSIGCAQMGARSVLGIEIDELRVKRAKLMKEVLEVDNVEFINKSLYDFKNEKFDVVMGLGLLHRIPDMVTFLQQASEMTDTLILEYKSFQSEDDCCYDGKEQMKVNKYNKLHQVPTDLYVENRLRELGFNSFLFVEDDKSHLQFTRSICIAKKGDELSEKSGI